MEELYGISKIIVKTRKLEHFPEYIVGCSKDDKHVYLEHYNSTTCNLTSIHIFAINNPNICVNVYVSF